MAYKFQLGAFTASGSIKAEEGFDANDQNINNVGQVQADAIMPADAASGLEIDGESANNDTFAIKLKDNVAQALRIRQQGNDYLKFVTTNGGELIESAQNLRVSGSKLIQFAGADESIGMSGDFSALEVKSLGNINLSGSTVDIVQHDEASTGLSLAGTLITANATELNFLDAFGDATYNQASNDIVFFNGSSLKRESNNDFLNAISTDGLEVNSSQLRVKLSGSTLSRDGDGIGVADGGITNSQLSGNISADKLNFSADHFNSIGGALEIDFAPNSGLEIQASNGLRIDLASSNALELDGDGLDLKDTIAGARVFSGNITVGGNLTVQGTTTTVESETLLVKDSLIELNVVTGSEGRSSNSGAGLFISGSTSGNDVSFTLNADGGRFVASDGLGVSAGQQYFIGTDQVLSDATLGSTVVSSSLERVGALSAGSIASGFTAINVANVININSLDIDGATDISADLADGDLIIVDDGAGGTNRKATMSRIATYVGNNISETVQTVNSAGALSSSAGAIVLAQSASSAYTLTLEPAADSQGKIFKVKRQDGPNVTIDTAGSETIDGGPSIVLESEYAAVMLFSDGSNYHVV